MDVTFANDDLDRLEVDPHFTANLSQALVKAFRKKMQAIRSANDERDFHRQRSFKFEELQGKRRGQFSIRLNDQYRLVFEFEQGNPDIQKKTVVIIGIEDYH
jgi:proteic killer suppression protein